LIERRGRAVETTPSWLTELGAQTARLGDPVCPGQRRGRMGVLHDVMLGLVPARIAREPALLAQLGKTRVGR